MPLFFLEYRKAKESSLRCQRFFQFLPQEGRLLADFSFLFSVCGLGRGDSTGWTRVREPHIIHVSTLDAYRLKGRYHTRLLAS
jgi:hypothetical protein